MQPGSPAGVIDGQVYHQPGSMLMDRVGQLPELIHGCRLALEFHQSRIDPRQIQRCIRTPEASHPCHRGRGRVDRQQMDDPAAQCFRDMGQILLQIAELARRRDTCESLIVQLIDNGCFFFGQSLFRGDILAEQPCERAVDDIAGAAEIRMHRDSHIRAVGPDLHSPFIQGIELGFKVTYLIERDFYSGLAILDRYGHIPPGLPLQRPLMGVGMNDLLLQFLFTSQIRPQKDTPAGRNRTAVFHFKLKINPIPAVS